MIYAYSSLMNYQQYETGDKEVISMEGITKVELPEIEGLRETFSESTVDCGEPGMSGCGCL